ncbi:MAG: glucosamine-6-phosphate deaminase [Candidatus Bipolaricaulia bacterium]
MVRVEVESSYEEMSRRAAREVVKEILVGQAPVLGLPTGETPKGMYSFLARYYKQGLVDFSQVATFNLDEYYGINKDHPKSFNRYMKQNLFEKVNLKGENIHVPSGEITREEISHYCKEYEKEISRLGGIDLQILGIGKNGHIGFNEPGSSFDTRTRLVELARDTITDNFDNSDETFEEAITMGTNTIMEAKKIILLVSGRRKKEVVKQALQGPVREELPGTVLQLHPNVVAIMDEEAAEELDLQEVDSFKERCS